MLRVVRLAPRPNKAHILSKEHRETMTRFAMTLYAWAVAMTAGVVLAACTTDGVRIGNVYHVTPYSKNLVQYTADNLRLGRHEADEGFTDLIHLRVKWEDLISWDSSGTGDGQPALPESA